MADGTIAGDGRPDGHGQGHGHVFLAQGHEASERRTWAVIALCGAMMVAEIVGGLLFNSIALVADGLHMTTHAGALLLAAVAYRYARTHAADPRFTFGTGKLGDLAGFTSAIALAMISLLIGYEAIGRLIAPQPIDFAEAIPIAVLGLAVNVASVWLLGHGDHGHGHHHDDHHDDHHDHEHDHDGHDHDHHGQGKAGRDNNMRAAVVHVMADAAVSVFVIVGLVLGKILGWVWMDAVAGLAGAVVIASWAWSLVGDTGAILLDMNPDPRLCARIRALIEGGGDRLVDLHVWRVGPGHLAAIVCVATASGRDATDYRARLAGLPSLAHVTIEVAAVPA